METEIISCEIEGLANKSSLNRLVESVFTFSDPTEKASMLKRIFEFFRYKLHETTELTKFPICNESHMKKQLFQAKRGGETLKVELIYFTGLKWTEPHIHPQYLVEWVLDGEIQEQKFKLEHGKFIDSGQNTRRAGDYRMVCAEDGHPHRVRGHDGPAFVLCVSLGTREVEPIYVFLEEEK